MSFKNRKKSFARAVDAGTEVVDYKDLSGLKNYITESHKIVPARITGVSARFQRQLATAIKQARYLALIPYCDQHVNE